MAWDPYAPVTPLGQLVYCSQFLASAGLLRDWVADSPLQSARPHGPSKTGVMGPVTLSMLAGHRRSAHVTALRGDMVKLPGLGRSGGLSEDAVRRACPGEATEPLERWQRPPLWRRVEPELGEPWICDLDVTIQTV